MGPYAHSCSGYATDFQHVSKSVKQQKRSQAEQRHSLPQAYSFAFPQIATGTALPADAGSNHPHTVKPTAVNPKPNLIRFGGYDDNGYIPRH